ncbi:hypothetical protein [Streptomyces humi]|uniref:hypothetical protein n=1 Tax=Streptomyces humi TaxID=1428620 RepID=UPI0008FCCB53|nr:hypothetical protein [Streptomyces humi]
MAIEYAYLIPRPLKCLIECGQIAMTYQQSLYSLANTHVGGNKGWHRPTWLTMNVWTVTSGIVGLALSGLGTYLMVPASSTQASTGYAITTPSEADRIGLCLHSVKGAGQVPKEGALWLVVHGVGNRGYYLSRQVQPDTSGNGWGVGSLQVGNAASPEGQQYDLILWRLDPRLTDVVDHVFTAEGMPVFVGPPEEATTVAHTTVVRTADRHPC